VDNFRSRREWILVGTIGKTNERELPVASEARESNYLERGASENDWTVELERIPWKPLRILIVPMVFPYLA